ncbi:YopX family protein [uncultured Brevibacillus sp.]|uniref:YopX family protein n=1 Tax=uncultured Brevibacillus sp. TaxID=169970 RepID=UPI00259657CE|nr:YopX family protein [uncultured Brevibacillus sp.]
MQVGRVIKFRAWDPDREKMMIPMVLNWWQDEGAPAFMSEFIDRDAPHECTTKYMYEVDMLQYAGIHDKKGNEIYAGDIVELPLDGGETRLLVVAIETVMREVVSHPSFDGATAKVAITGVVFKWKGYELFPCINKGIPDNLKMEVVGNIYENPELLEVGK